ncbi:hypothetical protein FA15DRAFT_296169 [Coprinopsis marcescibilis]|uniref:Uncharacterized protein n=1 Tax=Coprinopsis marcescibilis TaxID=230819 RepID=A0A5C3KD46_COPMA|nr:hypothetical protein FA15DRAFT_296169 [Coprinopsis marcescibilis]
MLLASRIRQCDLLAHRSICLHPRPTLDPSATPRLLCSAFYPWLRHNEEQRCHSHPWWMAGPFGQPWQIQFDARRVIVTTCHCISSSTASSTPSTVHRFLVPSPRVPSTSHASSS